MKTKEILNTTTHRPWELPNENWKFYQEWNNTIFLHWEVDIKELQKFVPPEIEIDLFEGKPWVSLVAFSMEKIRPKNLPCFPPISNFDEINIRTYVKYKGKTGVYFLSIEGGKRISCKVAKSLSELPYRFSKMDRKKDRYKSENVKNNDCFEIQYKIDKALISKTKIDFWLTERYALFQDTKTAINQFEIHHLEWPINELKIESLKVKYPKFEKLINSSPDKIAYSKGVQVIAYGKKKYPRN
jgi:uncharacterized protein YqjF (DUF2071 family)